VELLQYVIDNWETITIILAGLGVTGFSGYKGGKALQKKLDSSQWKGINENIKDILNLQTDMAEVKTAITKNTEDDITRYESLQKIVSDTNNTVKEIQRELKDADKATIKRLREQLRNGG